MRDAKANDWMVRNSPAGLGRTIRLALVATGIGLIMVSGAARAQEDDDDDKTFED